MTLVPAQPQILQISHPHFTPAIGTSCTFLAVLRHPKRLIIAWMNHNSKLRDEFLNGEIFYSLKGGAGPGGEVARPLQHRATTLLAGLSTTRHRGMAGGDQNRVWRSGKLGTLPTSPHPRLRRDINKTRCATLTIQLVQNIGQTISRRRYQRQGTKMGDGRQENAVEEHIYVDRSMEVTI